MELNYEQAVLGSVLNIQSRKQQFEILAELGRPYFVDATMQKIFTAFESILVADRTAVTLVGAYERLEKMFPGEVPVETLSTLASKGAFSLSIAQSHAKELIFAKYRRDVERAIASGVSAVKKAATKDEFEVAKTKLIAETAAIEPEGRLESIDHKRYTKLLMQSIDRDKMIDGYSWDLHDLDIATSGIVTPRFIIIGGLKKSGKSRFLMFLRRVLYKQNVATPFISLEMPPYELVKLTYATFTGIDDIKFQSKNFLSNKQREDIRSLELDWDLMPTEHKASLDVHQIISRIRRYSKLYPGGVILIDYLQRIKHDRHKQAQELEEITALLGDATREYNTTVILLSQLQNLAEREVPSMGHLKGSGGIGEAGDVILLLDNLYRRDKSAGKGKIDIYLEQRYGESAKIELIANLGCCDFKLRADVGLSLPVFEGRQHGN